MSKKNEIKASVNLDLEEALEYSELNDKNTKALADVIKNYWKCYLHMDKEGIAKYISNDVRKMPEHRGKVSDGAEQFLNDISLEWTQYERPDSVIAIEMEIYDLNIWADDKSSPTYAIVNYWNYMEGGARWEFEENHFVLQIFKYKNDTWKLIHFIDGAADDEDENENGFDLIFEYAYPVNDLQRAINFYSPILGKPDFVTDSQAYFRLKNPGFFLDNSGLFGFAEVHKNKGNGFPIVYVKNIENEIKRLKNNDVQFLAGTDRDPKIWNNDKCVLIKDIDGNVLAIMERNYKVEKGNAAVTGFTGDSKYIKAAKKAAEAWMNKDSESLSSLVGKDGSWFDCSRVKLFGLHYGKKEIVKYLKRHYWKNVDHTENSITGIWAAKNFKEVSLDDYTIVSYEREFTGNGNHMIKMQSFVTHIFESPDELVFTVINDSTMTDNPELDLDYCQHPVRNLKKAEKFYTKQLQFGDPYSDEGYRGYWSDNSVYGIYEVEEDEHLIKYEKTNGDASFSIMSAEETYKYLKKQNVHFPLIASQNDKQGIDRQPGYIQIVAIDSEGNIVTFTEYTGERE